MAAPYRSPEPEASSRHALVSALHPDSGRFKRCVEASADRIDWAWVVERATAHKVAALLAARTEEVGILPALSADIQTRLRSIRQEAGERVTLAQRTLARLTEELRRVDVPFFVIKGSVLAEHVYGDPSRRRFVDIDIVVPPGAVDRAAERLRSMGYRLGQAETILGARPQGPAHVSAAQARVQRFYERHHYELPFDRPPRTDLLSVDLHWHIAPRYRIAAPADQLWQHTVAVQVGTQPVTTLDPAATLIHLAAHAIPTRLSDLRLLHLCDVAWAAARWPATDGGLWELAEAWGAATHLAAVFALIERGLGMPIPAHLRPRAPRQRWYGPWLRAVATETFLTDDYRTASHSTARRAWAELAWNIAMRCLWPHTLVSLRVRVARLQWALFTWRQQRGS